MGIGIIRILNWDQYLPPKGYSHKVKIRTPIGYVYIMQHGDLFKIGRSSNVLRRFREFKTANPDISLFHYIETNNMVDLEFFYHEKFNNKRITGEWFKLGVDDINNLKQIEKMNKTNCKWEIIKYNKEK